MAQPLVSVIMPAYNGEKYIGRAIQSVLHQTYKNFELIIVDDKSTDNTLGEIGKISDSRIKLIENEINHGIAYSTNLAIESSNGKYIALLDDDDEAFPERLEKQVMFLESNLGIDVLGGKTVFIDAENNILKYGAVPRRNPNLIKAILLFRCMDFMNSTVMYRREFIENNNIRYRDNCLGMQDYKFYIECSKVGTISTIDEYLLKHRIHDNNETDRQMKNPKRKELYAKFQRDSLKDSGFMLTEKELACINKCISEANPHCESKEEFIKFYDIMSKIIQQGKDRNIEYLDELKFYIKSILGKMIPL